jgi:hypothetical protein
MNFLVTFMNLVFIALLVAILAQVPGWIWVGVVILLIIIGFIKK